MEISRLRKKSQDLQKAPAVLIEEKVAEEFRKKVQQQEDEVEMEEKIARMRIETKLFKRGRESL
jgi:hypothetical protein